MANFLVLYCSSITKTAIFWKSLGFEILQQENDKVVVSIAGLEYHYVQEKTEPFEEYQFATEKAHRGLGSLYYFERDDLAQLYKQISLLKPTHLTEIVSNHWQGQEFLFSDPDGFLFVAYKLLS